MKTKNIVAILLKIVESISCGKNDPNFDTSELRNIHIGLHVVVTEIFNPSYSLTTEELILLR